MGREGTLLESADKSRTLKKAQKNWSQQTVGQAIGMLVKCMISKTCRCARRNVCVARRMDSRVKPREPMTIHYQDVDYKVYSMCCNCNLCLVIVINVL